MKNPLTYWRRRELAHLQKHLEDQRYRCTDSALKDMLDEKLTEIREEVGNDEQYRLHLELYEIEKQMGKYDDELSKICKKYESCHGWLIFACLIDFILLLTGFAIWITLFSL